MAAAKIVDLRKFLAERFPHPPSVTNCQLSTGLNFFDATSGGGLPKGAITEVISPQISGGSASLIHKLIRNARSGRYFVALIDGQDSFDPQTLEPECLRQLLWVRCTKTAEAVKAADLLLRDGNFSLVIVDLHFNPAIELRKIPQTSWYRLQRLVESASTACLVLTRHSLIGSAQLKIVLENPWSWQSSVTELRFRVRRSHLRSEITSQMAKA